MLSVFDLGHLSHSFSFSCFLRFFIFKGVQPAKCRSACRARLVLPRTCQSFDSSHVNPLIHVSAETRHFLKILKEL